MLSKLFEDNTSENHHKNLPERVVEAIRLQQDASERLVGWLQLAVVLLFGLLYAVAPKTFSPDATFTPVPWILAIYVFLTIIRLILAYRPSLKNITNQRVYVPCTSQQRLKMTSARDIIRQWTASDSTSDKLKALINQLILLYYPK